MNAPIQKTAVTLADYKAAEERLRRTQTEATAAFNKAQEAGDLAKGEELIAQQREALDAFKAFRSGISGDVLLSIHGDRILESFSIDTENFVNLVIPRGVSDEEAMRALNARFRELFPEKNRDAIYEDRLEDILNAGAGSGRRAREPRVVKLIGVVPDTICMTRNQQAEALQRNGLTFAHPIEQALAAAAFACKNDGGDLFNQLLVRGSVPGCALGTLLGDGIAVSAFTGSDCAAEIAVSGSPPAKASHRLRNG